MIVAFEPQHLLIACKRERYGGILGGLGAMNYPECVWRNRHMHASRCHQPEKSMLWESFYSIHINWLKNREWHKRIQPSSKRKSNLTLATMNLQVNYDFQFHEKNYDFQKRASSYIILQDPILCEFFRPKKKLCEFL